MLHPTQKLQKAVEYPLGMKYILFGRNGNTIKAQKPKKGREGMPLNSLIQVALYYVPGPDTRLRYHELGLRVLT